MLGIEPSSTVRVPTLASGGAFEGQLLARTATSGQADGICAAR